MSNRVAPLPRGPLRGSYRIGLDLIENTRLVLSEFDQAGYRDGGHEGICFWAGRELPDFTTFEAVIRTAAEHWSQFVLVSEAGFGEAVRRARAMGLGILAQVHSHPGLETEHSDGDDCLVMMPFENMLSLVAPSYGRTLRSIDDFSIHQFPNGIWVLCSQESISNAVEVVTSNAYQ